MSAADKYRARALEATSPSRDRKGCRHAGKFENLAAAFMRLATHAERNAELVIDFELPSEADHKPKSR